MIYHLKIGPYKGIKSIELTNLGNVNVICGRNSSGKSSILESISGNSSFVGQKIEHKSLVDLFISKSAQTPFMTREHIEWFKEYLHNFLETKQIWFTNEIKNIADVFLQARAEYGKQHNFTVIMFNYFDVFEEQVKAISFAKVLIPPKRQVNTLTAVYLNEDVSPGGEGLINKLFFLKNHDLSSAEFKIFEKIDRVFKEITGHKFNIFPHKSNKSQPTNDLSLQFKLRNDWMNAEDCGLGLKDVLFMITFIEVTEEQIYLIEEPENHLHADFQKKLLSYFRQQKGKQFILSTHSNIFLDPNLVDKIFFCWFDGEVKISDKTSLSKMLDALGYPIIENLTSDAMILTEGQTDIHILKKIFSLTGTLNDFNIRFTSLGGDNMATVDLSLFANIKSTFAIIDRDPGSEKIRNQFKKNCIEHNIKCFQLEKYAIENYIPLGLIKNAFPGKLSNSITEISSDSPVEKQLGFSVKGNLRLADGLVKKNIENTDLWKIALEIDKAIREAKPLVTEPDI